MRILAIDLGTNTGWATGDNGNLTGCGTWTLATDSEIRRAGQNRMNRRLDPRIPALWRKLSPQVDWIVFEDVQFSSTTMQTQLWSSFRTVLWLFASLHGIQVECLAVGKLKLFGAGHGGATKEMMARALVRQQPEEFSIDTDGKVHYFANAKDDFLDDNAVDAVHLLKWAMKTFRNQKV